MTDQSSSSKKSSPIEKEDSHERTTFTVLQKKSRDRWASSERSEKLLREVHEAKWHVVVISETWRPSEEVWQIELGHDEIESDKFTKKHGVTIILNRRWRNKINWAEYASERVIATPISIKKQQITLASTYLSYSDYPDHQIEKTYGTIWNIIDKDRDMKIIGDDFNAELGPDIDIELSNIDHYTLNKANCRDEWMT